MIYTTSQTPTETALVAKVAVWRTLLIIHPVPSGGPISHTRQPGEVFSQAEWRDIATRIKKAIDGKDDDNTVRIWFDREQAQAVVDAARSSE